MEKILPKITIPTGVIHKPIHKFLKKIHIPERYFLCDHAFHIYDWILTIPFILKANKLSEYQKSIHYQVRQIDLAPSLLEILDVQIPKGLDGISLLPFIYGKEELRFKTIMLAFSQISYLLYDCFIFLHSNILSPNQQLAGIPKYRFNIQNPR